MTDLTQARLKELLCYDSATGQFIWRVFRRGRAQQGEVAGTNSGNGYRVIKVDNKSYQAHILAWLYMTGDFPESGIDHENNNTYDNSWGNLRLATQQQNMFNRTLNKNNKSGVKGVSYVAKYNHYTVRVSNVYYGCFKTLEEAAIKTREVRELLHGEFINHG